MDHFCNIIRKPGLKLARSSAPWHPKKILLMSIDFKSNLECRKLHTRRRLLTDQKFAGLNVATSVIMGSAGVGLKEWAFLLFTYLVVAVSSQTTSVADSESEAPAVLATRSRIRSEAALRNKLFHDENNLYERKVRPSGNTTDTVSVYISMRVLHLEGVEEQRQVLKIHTWMSFKWNDPRLRWNSPDYANITALHTADEDLWLPDIALYNNAEGKDIHNYGSTTIMIQSNGDVLWAPPASFSAQCNMTFDTWPLDAHRCHLIVGSWTTHGWDMDLQLGDNPVAIDTQGYVESDKWKLLEITANRTLQQYPCCSEPYISLSFSVHIRRNPGHYAHTLKYPASILLLSSWFLFLLPDPRFRHVVGLVQLLAFCGESIFLWTIAPPTNGTPPIVSLVAASIGCVAYAMLLCLLLDKIASLRRSAPNWIRSRMNVKLGPLLGVLPSRYFAPNALTEGSYPVLESNSKDMTASMEFETDDQGVEQTVGREDSAHLKLESLPDRSWIVFASILSRICLLHYVVLTIVILALHA
ncbi:putative Acetylcholine receptor subunit alpha-like 1 [Hypsibius exemplaris]|uniref:Acetylcholine receptor subunit alpha-like 1 n=1 Tax=Hypsibius exemplaris TaxID=2072580 RepID=A0A1W0XAD2_HYPEX|nr:putative Acetylcholine receptor subunit alpha-like 1 [Hypsibius exemplaris]